MYSIISIKYITNNFLYKKALATIMLPMLLIQQEFIILAQKAWKVVPAALQIGH